MSEIQVFNTLTGKKEPFVPASGTTVTMYACGPTVYDLSHLGHARMSIVWDVVQRYLRFFGFDVTFVRNITDVDDKIIRRAGDLGVSPEMVAREFTYTYWHDMHRLNVQPPDYEPRATEFISRMVSFIEELIKAGHAYESQGDVYFDVASFADYGKLGKKNLEQLMTGAREQAHSQDELSQRKRSPVDFALWKRAEESASGLSWESPWGRGRPGWHLECSTMIKHVLGKTIDIHTGGEDLVFPHHENEIAQSEALHQAPLARYWLHNSFVQVSSEKMSKSLGNFSTIDDLLRLYSADTIRLFVLQTHYRNPIDFTLESLNATKAAMSRLLRAVYADRDANGTQSAADGTASSVAPGRNTMGTAAISPAVNRLKLKEIEGLDPLNDDVTREFRASFVEAMNNDFNTAQAVSHLFSLADHIFQEKDREKSAAYATVLSQHAALLGFTLEDTRQQIDSPTSSQVLDLVLELRKSARAKKDYETSDLIRKHLQELGINVMDTSGGASWERA